jgi:catechol 2,3-dioxygenase-like lactoylglutathione lyase family enzyme
MIGIFDHSSLNVNDLDVSIEFYSNAFGYTLEFREDGVGREINQMTGVEKIACNLAQMKAPDGRGTLELIQYIGQQELPSNFPKAAIHKHQGHVGFKVESLKLALVEASELGARAFAAVATFPECLSCYLEEPGGSIIELTEYI